MKQLQLVSLLLGLLVFGCKEEVVPVLGQISGNIDLQLARGTDITRLDRSALVMLIQNGDTLARHQIISNSFFDQAYFQFPDLPLGAYELLIVKPGYVSRHFANMELAESHPLLSGSVEMYPIPFMNIDTISSEIVVQPLSHPYAFWIRGRFSFLPGNGFSDNFVAFFRKGEPASPTKHDFHRVYVAYKPELNDTLPVHTAFFTNSNYQSRDTIHGYFAPSLYGLHDSQVHPFGESVVELSYPFVNVNNSWRVKMVIP